MRVGDMPDGTGTSRQDWDGFWGAQGRAGRGGASWSKRRIMAVLGRRLKEGMAVLDAGCGSGFFSAYFIGRGCRTYSLDYSSEALDMARRITDGRAEGYIQADLLDAGFGEKYKAAFDLVFTDGLFEHFGPQDQARIMGNFKRALKPGGLVVTFCPNRYSPWELIRPFYMPGIKETPFTGAGMARLHAGLEVVESGGINALPVGWSPERLLGRRFGMLLYVVARKA